MPFPLRDGRATGALRAHALTRLALGALLLLAACAPMSQERGPLVGEPRLAADHAVMADGARLPLRLWLPAERPPDALIVALHGFNDYSNAFDGPASFWADHGIATLAYDQRGFGATARAGIWPGTAALVSDLEDVVALARRRFPDQPLYLLGESMGGAVLLAAAGTGALAVDGMVLVAPAVRGRATMNPLYRGALWVTAHLFPWMEATGEGLGIVASDNVEMIRGLQNDPLVIKSTRFDAVWGLVNLMDAALEGAAGTRPPLLLTYGAHDELIPREPTAALVARLGDRARIAVYEAGYHMLLRDLNAATPLSDIAGWVRAPHAPLTSNAEATADSFFRAPADHVLAEGQTP